MNDRFRVSVLFRFCKMRTTIWFFFLSFYLFSLSLLILFFLLRPGQKRRSFFFLPFFLFYGICFFFLVCPFCWLFFLYI